MPEGIRLDISLADARIATEIRADVYKLLHPEDTLTLGINDNTEIPNELGARAKEIAMGILRAHHVRGGTAMLFTDSLIVRDEEGEERESAWEDLGNKKR